jgi:hypothetical protein
VKKTHKSSFQAFRRIIAWILAQPTLMALPMMAAFIAQFEAVLDELSGSAAGQDSHFRLAKGVTAEKGGIKRDVMDQMRLVASVAAISIPDVVKVTAALQMPSRKADAEGLVTAGIAMADAAETHQAALVKQGLVPDAITQLRASAAQFKAAIDSRGQLVAQRRGATAEVGVQLATARKLVDAIAILVTRGLRDDPSKLAEWTQLKRVTQKPGGRATTVNQPPVVSQAPAAEPASAADSTSDDSKVAAEIQAPATPVPAVETEEVNAA